MDFAELLNKRRSIRDFENKEVPLDLVKEIINESILAPSGSNAQPWSFIIVKNKDLIKRISDSSKSALLDWIREQPDSSAKDYQFIVENEDFNVFYNASCLVLIIGPIEGVMTIEMDCASLACYFMFSATSKGLGTCWVGLGSAVTDPVLKKEIGIPEEYKIYVPIILGYPTEIPPILTREEPKILKVIT
jgi:nitroreductase